MAHKVVNGRYFSAAIEYRKDPCLKYHLALYKSLIESLSASETGTVQLLLFWGRPVRDWKKQVYGEGDQVVTKNAQAFFHAFEFVHPQRIFQGWATISELLDARENLTILNEVYNVPVHFEDIDSWVLRKATRLDPSLDWSDFTTVNQNRQSLANLHDTDVESLSVSILDSGEATISSCHAVNNEDAFEADLEYEQLPNNEEAFKTLLECTQPELVTDMMFFIRRQILLGTILTVEERLSVIRHHNQLRHDAQPEVYKFACGDCGMTFASRHGVTHHDMKYHADNATLMPVECPVSSCSTRFHEERNMKMHVAKSHSELCDSHCQYCGRGFYRDTGSKVLEEHVRDTHAQDDPTRSFPCPVTGCLRAYKHEGSLTYHIKTHPEDDPVVVAYLHNVLQNVKPKAAYSFPCPVTGCLRTYVHEGALITHVKTHPEDDPDVVACLANAKPKAARKPKKYRCPFDDCVDTQGNIKKFESEGGLSKHMKNDHPGWKGDVSTCIVIPRREKAK